MAAPQDADEAIDQALLGLQSATVDGNTVTHRSADDLIKLANYQAAQNAKAKPHFGVRFSKIVPPGGG